MFIIFSAAGITGYLIYGYSSEIIISTSMVKNPGGVLPKIVAGLVIVKNYLTLNPFIAVLCDSSEVMMGIEESPMKQRIFRSFALLLSAAIAYMAYDAVPFVESLSSAACVMLSSFIFPAVLYGVVYRGYNSCKIKCTSSFISIFGVVMMGVLAYGAIDSLMHPDV